jgi:hypothetical protein
MGRAAVAAGLAGIALDQPQSCVLVVERCPCGAETEVGIRSSQKLGDWIARSGPLVPLRLRGHLRCG